jgi:hypothetical protein
VPPCCDFPPYLPFVGKTALWNSNCYYLPKCALVWRGISSRCREGGIGVKISFYCSSSRRDGKIAGKTGRGDNLGPFRTIDPLDCPKLHFDFPMGSPAQRGFVSALPGDEETVSKST